MEKTSHEKNESYNCQHCHFMCRYKSDWNRHITTQKHLNKSHENASDNVLSKPKDHICENCNKLFHSQSGLWKHTQKCKISQIQLLEEESKNKDKIIANLLKLLESKI